MFGFVSLFGELLCDHFMESPNSGSVPTPNISRQSKASLVIFLLCGQPEGLLDGSRSPNYWFREFLVNRIFFSFGVWVLRGYGGRLLMCPIYCLKLWNINVGLKTGLDKHPASIDRERTSKCVKKRGISILQLIAIRSPTSLRLTASDFSFDFFLQSGNEMGFGFLHMVGVAEPHCHHCCL